jgi:hypothetical protein
MMLGKTAKRKKAIFDEQFIAFWGGSGSTVHFRGKNSAMARIEWTVVEVERDWQACKWTKGGKMPLFIKLEREVALPGGKKRKETCWTFTEALQNPDTKGRWRV